jgi:pimeloyl-ACP methyl ester carboxylesterase
VLLLHGFPEFWWAWRHQLPALASAGYRAVAMDLRGYGGSDKTPRGYDPVTLAGDVSGVVKALGERSAVLVGHGWGGYVAWATAVVHAREVAALATVAAPHPLAMLAAGLRGHRIGAMRHVAAMQLPWLPERRLADPASGFLLRHLTDWSSGSSSFPTDEDVATYQAAISLWPASHCALEYHRWLVRSRVRADGRDFGRRMQVPVDRPVLAVTGVDDGAVPADAVRRSRRHVSGPMTEYVAPGAGHFVAEENPTALTEVLCTWLAGL